MATKKPYPSDKLDQYIVRFPDGMRDRLKEAAAENKRSLNAEIIARLEASFDPASEVEFKEYKRRTEMVMRFVNEMADEIDRRGIDVPTIRRRFDDYNPSEARKKAQAEAEAAGLKKPKP